MKVVCHKDGWVLTRMGRELEGIADFPTLTYYINHSLYAKTDGITAALFTHLEPDRPRPFIEAAKSVDIAIAMSHNTAKEVLKYRDECHVIQGGTDFSRELTFGVVGRTYQTGRKGEYLIQNMVDAGYNVIALGEGWPCPIFAPDNTNEKYDTDIRERFYAEIDYLVIPSLNEGGPIPVLDALGMRVPVIAPDVGWCWEYSVIRYEKGNWDSLRGVLESLTPPTWEDWKQDHINLFNNLCK